jgi:hypothetical protein
MANASNRVGGVLQRIDCYPDHLRAIGLIITDFGSLEGRLCLLLWELLDDPDRGSAVFWSLGSSKARCDVVRGVAGQILIGDEWLPLRAEINRVVSKVRKAAEKRNDIAHAQWGVPSQKSENPFMTIERPAAKDHLFQRRWTVAELEAVADEIAEAEKQVNNVIQVFSYMHEPEIKALYDTQHRKENPRTDAYLRRLLPPRFLDHRTDQPRSM